jgi:beta-N-acetylhexosaminidase
VSGDLRGLAASVVCTGFNGTALPDDLQDLLTQLPLAGVILFARNIQSIAQTRKLCDLLIAASKDGLPPIVAIDQEGGPVMRLRDGVEPMPAMCVLGSTGDAHLAYSAGEQVAFDLRRAGVNVNFAPVVDLSHAGAEGVIGERSFGEDPELVTAMAGSFSRGLRSGGIVPTLKHFPGHGATPVDSHVALPIVDLNEREWRERHLVPFVRLLPDAPAVMTAHLVARAFDDARLATTSHELLTAVLRDRIGFHGVCFTDCIQMQAIAAAEGSVHGAVAALQAGADCVLISHSVPLAFETIEAIASAAERGDLSPLRLEEASSRVGALRASLQPALALDAASPHAGICTEIESRAR